MEFGFEPDVAMFDENGDEAGRQSFFWAEHLGSDGRLHYTQAYMAANPDPVINLYGMELIRKILKQQMIDKGVWSEDVQGA